MRKVKWMTFNIVINNEVIDILSKLLGKDFGVIQYLDYKKYESHVSKINGMFSATGRPGFTIVIKNPNIDYIIVIYRSYKKLSVGVISKLQDELGKINCNLKVYIHSGDD